MDYINVLFYVDTYANRIRWECREAGIVHSNFRYCYRAGTVHTYLRHISAYYIRRSGNKVAFQRRPGEHLHATTSGWLDDVLFISPLSPVTCPSPHAKNHKVEAFGCMTRCAETRVRGILTRVTWHLYIHIVYSHGKKYQMRKSYFS